MIAKVVVEVEDTNKSRYVAIVVKTDRPPLDLNNRRVIAMIDRDLLTAELLMQFVNAFDIGFNMAIDSIRGNQVVVKIPEGMRDK